MLQSTWLEWPSRNTLQHLLLGVVVGVSISSSLVALRNAKTKTKLRRPRNDQPIELRQDGIVRGVAGLIGNTPLVRIDSLSDALGVEILGKAEFLNPGGSVKDRVALRMIEDAERLGYIRPHTGSRIFEGTVGSTGISIATIARAKGYETTIIMPDDVAEEKVKALEALGATVERVRPTSIVDQKQYVNLAQKRAKEFGQNQSDTIEATDTSADHLHPRTFESQSFTFSMPAVTDSLTLEDDNWPLQDARGLDYPRGFFADQFENRSNFDAHFNGTGPEIWRQTAGRLDAFVAGSGTGGTTAGTGHFLKTMNESVLVAIADPQGSGLYNKIKYGVMYDRKESEGTKRRHQVDTVVEGIGINRLTKNIELALPILDDAFRVTDEEAVAMSRYLVQHDGLFLGSSSACNLVACIKLVKKMGWSEGQTVVTILCDSGTRHYSKFWNDAYLKKAGIAGNPEIIDDLLRSPLP